MDASRFVYFARRKAGLSQRELGREAGVPQPTVARIERGTVTPRFDTLDRLLTACGFDLSLEPARGIGIDRSAIRDLLSLSPAERARIAMQEGRNLLLVPDRGAR